MARFKSFGWLVIPIFVWFFYNGLLMHNYGRFRVDTKSNQYFKYLAGSFLAGRLDLSDCPPTTDCHDLVNYNGKIYLYWPPVPALIYMPFVAISGSETPDQLIASLFGALNILLFSLFIYRLSLRYDWRLSYLQIAMIILFWGMGTVHFYMSMLGTVWTSAQIMAQTFLLLTLLIFIKGCTRYCNLFWSGFFLH